MPVFNIPGSYSYSGDSAGGYLPPHSPTQPDFYPASVNYSSPQSRVGSGRSGPPSGPRGLPSRKRPVDASSDVQSEGRQPPSAPRAMLEKLGSQEGKPSFAKEKIRINKSGVSILFYFEFFLNSMMLGFQMPTPVLLRENDQGTTSCQVRIGNA